MEFTNIYRVFNFIIFIGYPVASISAFISLRKRNLSDINSAIWTLIILLIPIIGTIIMFAVNPKQK